MVTERFSRVDIRGAMNRFPNETRLEGTTMSTKRSWGLCVGFLSILGLLVLGLMAGNAFAAQGMPSSG
ncbi:MAG TPA: hypothetical protein VES58_04330, partial [Syntrophobacteria bacterium]|nr:hypothetical protein [Syntrophobacteria bacterium]